MAAGETVALVFTGLTSLAAAVSAFASLMQASEMRRGNDLVEEEIDGSAEINIPVSEQAGPRAPTGSREPSDSAEPSNLDTPADTDNVVDRLIIGLITNYPWSTPWALIISAALLLLTNGATSLDFSESWWRLLPVVLSLSSIGSCMAIHDWLAYEIEEEAEVQHLAHAVAGCLVAGGTFTLGVALAGFMPGL